MTALPESALATLFNEARTHNHWLDKPVDEAVLRSIYDTMKYGPTSANCSPQRVIFVTSEAGKARLKPCLMQGNQAKTMAAPVCAILAMDMTFYEALPTLFPHADARSWFVGNQALIEETAFRNASLQGAYLIIAARAHGLDCGPMSGFDQEALNREFFAEMPCKANFLCNLGYGDPAALHPRAPRPNFDEVCRLC